jgi:hypothetical protein
MGGQLFSCLLALAFTVPRIAPTPAPALDPTPHARAHAVTLLQVDSHVLANLLTEAPMRKSDLPLTVVAGEIARCESTTCTVPLTLRASGAQGPVTLAFAVANARGELSDVQHAACGMGSCSVSLVLTRGRNTVSIGVIDPIAQLTAYTTLHVDANRRVAASTGKTEWF